MGAGNAEMVGKLGASAEEAGKNNVSFLSYFLLGDLERCLEILITSNRIPEAAFFARTYLPSEISRVVDMWRVQLGKVNEKAGQSLADPKDYPNLFPDYAASLQAQQMLARERKKVIPAEDWKEIMANYERKPLEEMHALAEEEEEINDEGVDDKDHPIAGAIGLRDQLEMDLDNLKLDDIDTTDVNL